MKNVLTSIPLASRLLRDYLVEKESEMLKEKMTQELQNVRAQSAQYQQEIATHEARIKDLQAGIQRLQGAELMLTHLLSQPEEIATPAEAATVEAPPEPSYEPEAEVLEMKKPKKSKKKKQTA